MKVEYRPQAAKDLEEIWDYISQFDSDAADRQLDRIEQSLTRLVEYPFSAPAFEEAGEGVRKNRATDT